MTKREKKKTSFIFGILLAIAVVYEIAYIFATLFKGASKPIDKLSEKVKKQEI